MALGRQPCQPGASPSDRPHQHRAPLRIQRDPVHLAAAITKVDDCQSGGAKRCITHPSRSVANNAEVRSSGRRRAPNDHDPSIGLQYQIKRQIQAILERGLCNPTDTEVWIEGTIRPKAERREVALNRGLQSSPAVSRHDDVVVDIDRDCKGVTEGCQLQDNKAIGSKARIQRAVRLVANNGDTSTVRTGDTPDPDELSITLKCDVLERAIEGPDSRYRYAVHTERRIEAAIRKQADDREAIVSIGGRRTAGNEDARAHRLNHDRCSCRVATDGGGGKDGWGEAAHAEARIGRARGDASQLRIGGSVRRWPSISDYGVWRVTRRVRCLAIGRSAPAQERDRDKRTSSDLSHCERSLHDRARRLISAARAGEVVRRDRRVLHDDRGSRVLQSIISIYRCLVCLRTVGCLAQRYRRHELRM